MLQNLRDAGGHLTRDGWMRTGVLYRGDAPVPDRHAGGLEDLGLNTIVDLRRGVERDRRPTLTWSAGQLVELPLVGDERIPADPLIGGLASFNRWLYESAAGARPDRLRPRLTRGDSRADPLHRGKDRTGLPSG